MMLMRGQGPNILFWGMIFIAGGAALAIASEASPSRDRLTREREFQQLVGGLGTGPALERGLVE